MHSIGIEFSKIIKDSIEDGGLNEYLDGHFNDIMPFNYMIGKLEQLSPVEMNEVFLTILEKLPEYAVNFIDVCLMHLVDNDNFDDIKKHLDKKIYELNLFEL